MEEEIIPPFSHPAAKLVSGRDPAATDLKMISASAAASLISPPFLPGNPTFFLHLVLSLPLYHPRHSITFLRRLIIDINVCD